MQYCVSAICFLILLLSLNACEKKSATSGAGCHPEVKTIRVITHKKAIVKVTATATYPVYLVEEGSIDTKLIPCNFPDSLSYYKNDLPVIISGDVKPADSAMYGPCCSESFVITSITK